MQTFNNSHAAQLQQAVASAASDDADAFLRKQLASATKTQREYVVQTTLLLCNSRYARLLLAHHAHEISVRNQKYLRAIVQNF